MTVPVRPVSGEQFHIGCGGVTAQIGQVAAVLRSFQVDGVAFTETWPDDMVAPMGCGIVLVPWPNRIAGAAWELNGKKQQLDITEPSRGNASHGLLRNTAYSAVAQSADSITLGAAIYPQHGYPFSLDTSVRYLVSETGLTVRHTITNVGSGRAPFGVGAHPYLRVGDHPAADLAVTVDAASYAVVDDLIPTSVEPVAAIDPRLGLKVGAASVDVAFTDIEVRDGTVRHRLSAPDGTAVVLWAEPVFGWVQVFTPGNFPGSGPDQRPAVAIEPMTCAANAFNSGDGLLWLDPGETWSGTWGLRPEG